MRSLYEGAAGVVARVVPSTFSGSFGYAVPERGLVSSIVGLYPHNLKETGVEMSG